MLGFDRLRLGLRAVALEAERVALRTQQLRLISAVRLVAGRASLLERGLMPNCFLCLTGLVRVASQADVDSVGLRQALRLTRVRIVAVSAVARRARMLYLRR